jgi:PilZ domain
LLHQPLQPGNNRKLPANGQPEHRIARRFSMRLPVSVRVSNGGVHDEVCVTRDVSSRGIFFYSDTPMREGAEIEYVLTLPREMLMMDPVRIRYRGKVVRVEGDGATQFGVAASVHRFEYA